MNLCLFLAETAPNVADANQPGYWELITDGAILMVVGMLVVFLALVLIGAVLLGLNLWLADKQAPAAAPAPATAAAPEGGIAPQTLAVISAAVFAALGPRARVQRVSLLRSGPSAWAEQGRANIHGSHSIQKRSR